METKNNIKPGFIKTGKELLFSPIKLSSNSYQFQERTHSLNQIDKWVFNKINEKIREDGGLEQFISFDENLYEFKDSKYSKEDIIELVKHFNK